MGNYHVFADRASDLALAERFVLNTGNQRGQECNVAATLLVHANVADVFLPRLGQLARERAVEVRGCPATRCYIQGIRESTQEDYTAGNLDSNALPIVTVRVVLDLDEAIDHIARFGSGHAEEFEPWS
ncbi:MAG: hypothetical protein HY040_14440 [Planctomycetes bacterium]|nr:hypothetical protein [Planctomycetota bacterium]